MSPRAVWKKVGAAVYEIAKLVNIAPISLGFMKYLSDLTSIGVLDNL